MTSIEKAELDRLTAGAKHYSLTPDEYKRLHELRDMYLREKRENQFNSFANKIFRMYTGLAVYFDEQTYNYYHFQCYENGRLVEDRFIPNLNNDLCAYMRDGHLNYSFNEYGVKGQWMAQALLACANYHKCTGHTDYNKALKDCFIAKPMD